MKKFVLLAAFIEMMDSIFFEGYVNSMSSEEFNFEFGNFERMMKS